MLSTTHSSVAIGILCLPLPLTITIPLAILSHAVMDTLGESTYDNWVNWQICFQGILLLVGLLTNTLFIVALGIFLGNLFDVIDKIFSQRILGREIIHGSRFYPKLIVNLTSRQTFLFDLVLCSLAILIIK